MQIHIFNFQKGSKTINFAEDNKDLGIQSNRGTALG